MPDTDPLSAALEEIRKRYEVWGDASDTPRLLAALDAVLNRHRPAIATGDCLACAEPCPCREVQAITRALTGEASDET